MVNYPAENNRLKKIEDTLEKIVEMLEAIHAAEEVECAECGLLIDLETENEGEKPEYDIEEVVRSSGKVEELTMVYHVDCNELRIKENAIRDEQALAAAQHREFLRRAGF
jgi:hypothetical protein